MFTRLSTTWFSSSAAISARSSCAKLPHTAWAGAVGPPPSARDRYSFNWLKSSSSASTSMTRVLIQRAPEYRRSIIEAVGHQHFLFDEGVDRGAKLFECVAATLDREPP